MPFLNIFNERCSGHVSVTKARCVGDKDDDDFFLHMIRDDGSGTLAKRSESCLDACVLYRGRTVTFFLFHQDMAGRGNYSEIFQNFPPKSSF